MPADLRDAIRDVPDFPKKGIIFKDITPVLGNADLLQRSIDLLSKTVNTQQVDKVVGIDARGFLFAVPVALELNAGFVPVRKKDKLPWKTHSAAYSLEYGENEVEIHADAIQPGEKVLLVDDLLATGGTASAAVELIRTLGGEVICAAFLIELSFLNGRNALQLDNVHSIISY